MGIAARNSIFARGHSLAFKQSATQVGQQGGRSIPDLAQFVSKRFQRKPNIARRRTDAVRCGQKTQRLIHIGGRPQAFQLTAPEYALAFRGNRHESQNAIR